MADEDEDRIDALAHKAAALADKGGKRLRRVRVASGDDVVELEWWPDTGPAFAATAGPATAAAAAAAATAADDGLVPVEAPVVGTFYRSPQPGAPPFVNEGDSVEVDQPVGIVEAMKIMNHIAAPVAGRVAKIAATDGEVVEYGQPLLWLEPA